jgi:hypothetical protein
MSKETLRHVVRCLRETGRFVDEEGEATNALADLIDADAMDAHQANGLAWAVSRWQTEVSQRPLVNVHRRTLDDTWRQVVRYFGGDPDNLLGPAHDALAAGVKACESFDACEHGSPLWCMKHGCEKATASGVALPRGTSDKPVTENDQ